MSPIRVPWGLSVAITLALYAVALGAFRWAAQQETGTPVLAVGVVVALADVVLRRLVRPPRLEGTADLARRLGWPLAGSLVGMGLVVAWVLGTLSDWWGVVGAAVAYFGAGQTLTELRSSQVLAPWRGPAVLGACGLAGTVGLLSASEAGFNLPIVLLAGGVLLVPVGLSLLSEDLLVRLPAPTQASTTRLLVVGAVLITAGLVLLLAVGAPRLPLGLGTLFLFVLVGAIASNNETDVIIVVSVVVLVWALAPRDVALEGPAIPTAGDTVLVALGDSFMSGEGAPQFFRGTNTKDDNECRRAPTAYPLVAVETNPGLADSVVFVACSGAKAVHLTEQVQYPEEGRITEGDETVNVPQAQHAGWLVWQGSLTPEVVLVSIGGNDALFGHIASTCVLPGSCAVLGQRWLDQLDVVAGVLERTYASLRAVVEAELGPDVPVVVVPYPNPIRPESCSWSALTTTEHRFLHGFTNELNTVIADAAGRAGFHVLDAMATALGDRGLRLCDGSQGRVGVNFVATNPVSGLIRQAANPVNWFHNSLHPNPRGHEAMAATLAGWLQERPDLQALPVPADDGERHVAATLEQVMGDPDFDHCGRPGTSLRSCGVSTEQWRFDHTFWLVRLSVVPFLTLATGCWVFWLALLHRWRHRFPAA